ncbi:hypothetical protein [Massilia sp. S19_KUP03_FR1]|uniref:hypothetical protein n=1 Tax=Massilia sp. S19_KUP03_FR1 TaxID=3025503 RepID=UPI002FCD8114
MRTDSSLRTETVHIDEVRCAATGWVQCSPKTRTGTAAQLDSIDGGQQKSTKIAVDRPAKEVKASF